jgi:hypothetical protein
MVFRQGDSKTGKPRLDIIQLKDTINQKKPQQGKSTMKKVYISITNPDHWTPEYYLHIATRFEQVFKIPQKAWDVLGGLYCNEHLKECTRRGDLREAYITYKTTKGVEKINALKQLKEIDLHVAKAAQNAPHWYSIIFGLLSVESQKKALLSLNANKRGKISFDQNLLVGSL